MNDLPPSPPPSPAYVDLPGGVRLPAANPSLDPAASWRPAPSLAARRAVEETHLPLRSGMRVPVRVGRMRSTLPVGLVMLVSWFCSGVLFHAAGWMVLRSATFDAGRVVIDDGDVERLAPVVLPAAAAALVAVVSLMVWCRLVAGNLERAAQPGVRIGVATWGWLVPVWNLVGPFGELRRGRVAESGVTVWQLCVVIPIAFWAGVGFVAAVGVSQSFGDVFRVVAGSVQALWIGQMLGAAVAVVAFHRAFAEINRVRPG